MSASLPAFQLCRPSSDLLLLHLIPFLWLVVKVPIINHLEALRDEELEERREKRRKQLAEEEAKAADKAKDADDKEQNAQVGRPALWAFPYGCLGGKATFHKGQGG